MKNHGQHEIYLTGSKRRIKRSVYEKDGKFFIKWYGEYIEVERSGYGGTFYKTVESY